METTMEQIGTTILRLLMTDKFFCFFLSGIDRVVEYPDPTGKRKPRVPFAGVAKSDSLSYVMLFNSQGWDRLKALEATYKLENFCSDVIKHEGLHIAYGHPTQNHLYKHHDIANIAMDLEINQYLNDITAYNKNKKLGMHADKIKEIVDNASLTPEEKKDALDKFQETTDPIFMTLDAFGWQDEPNRGAMYYYDKLLAEADKYDAKMNAQGNQQCQGKGAGQGEGDSHGEKGQQHGKTKGMQKKDQAGTDDDTVGKMISGMRANAEFAQAIRDMLGNGNWKDFGTGNSDIDNDIMNNKIRATVKDIMERNLDIGNLPAGLKAELDRLIVGKQPVADWKRILSLWASKSITYFTKTSRRKPNKRNPEFAAIKVKSLIRIFVVGDSSGSMSNEDIRECLSEVENIRKVNKAEIDYGECDAELYINEICKVGRKTIMDKTSVSGRGGTSVQPAIDYVNENVGVYSLFIYLSDGWVPQPVRHCKIPMITVITKNGAGPEEVKQLQECGGFGKVIKTI